MPRAPRLARTLPGKSLRCARALGTASQVSAFEVLLRGVLVVLATAQLDPRPRVISRSRPRVEMVELQKVRRPAAPPLLTHEGTPSSVSLDHRPLDLRRNVPRRPLPVRLLWVTAMARRLRELPSSRLVTQQGECPIEYLYQLPVWNLMSKQRLNLAELLAEVLAGRELDLETLLPQGSGAGLLNRRGGAGAGDVARGGAGAVRCIVVSGSFRTSSLASGFGARLASNSSISRLLLCRARSSSAP